MFAFINLTADIILITHGHVMGKKFSKIPCLETKLSNDLSPMQPCLHRYIHCLQVAIMSHLNEDHEVNPILRSLFNNYSSSPNGL